MKQKTYAFLGLSVRTGVKVSVPLSFARSRTFNHGPYDAGIVRKLLGLKFIGETTPAHLVIGDARITGLSNEVGVLIPTDA